VQAQTDVVARDPALAALALGNDAVFLGELVSGLLEDFLGLQEASAGFAAQFKIPVLRKGLGEGEVLLLRTGAALLAVERGGAPPVATIAAAIELNFAAENAVICLYGHGRLSPAGVGGKRGPAGVLNVLAPC